MLKVHKFSSLKEFYKIFKLATAVYDQKQVIFNQKPINRLALLTGALRPQTCKYNSMFEISDMKK